MWSSWGVFGCYLLLCVDFFRLCWLCWWWQCWCNLCFWIITLPEDFGLTSGVFSIPSMLRRVMMIVMMIWRWEPFRDDYRSPNLLPIGKPNFFPVRNPNLLIKFIWKNSRAWGFFIAYLFPCFFPFELFVGHPFEFFGWLWRINLIKFD